MNCVFDEAAPGKNDFRIPCHPCVGSNLECDNERPCVNCVTTGRAQNCSNHPVDLSGFSAFEDISHATKKPAQPRTQSNHQGDRGGPTSQSSHPGQVSQDIQDHNLSIFDTPTNPQIDIPSLKTRNRVGHACSMCVKAKTKCDSQRPCKRCTRKGFQHLCTDKPKHEISSSIFNSIMCQHCLDNEKFCNGQRPCNSCIDFGCICIDSNEKRYSRPRAKVACAICFEAKTKCDNGRPCSRCVRKNIVDQCRDRPRKRSFRSIEEAEEKHFPNYRAKRACIHCAKAKTKCDSERPCSRCIRKDMAGQCLDRHS